VDPRPILASDAEREAVIGLLHYATAEGRLTLDEFSDRTRRAYTARTREELGALVLDLPMPYQPNAPFAPPVVPPAPTKNPTDLSLVSLILGAVSIPTTSCCFVGGVLGVVAMVLGVGSLRKIRRGRPGNRAMAIAGSVLGGAGVLAQIGLIILIVLDPGS
jgi:hypothetical protein